MHAPILLSSGYASLRRYKSHLKGPPNKFSAALEGESIDRTDQSMRVDDVISVETPRVDIEKAKAPGYEVPKDFSFAADVSFDSQSHQIID